MMTTQPNVTGKKAPGSDDPSAELARHHVLVVVDDDCVIPVREWCKRVGLSYKTWKRMRKTGEGPTVTWLSPNRIGIRLKHSREWLDARAETTA
jgi:hypothetical protein